MVFHASASIDVYDPEADRVGQRGN